MGFPGPVRSDFANVEALNRTFLRVLRRGPTGRELRSAMAAPLRPLVASLTDLQLERLAAAPFLLLSLREEDDEYWRKLIDDGAREDLFADACDGATSRLITAGVAFLWYTARRNPFAARLVSGASSSWCECMTGTTLIQLIDVAAGRQDLLQARQAHNEALWERLLGAGLSSEKHVRFAAHRAALQSVLTKLEPDRYGELKTAACRAPTPSLQVAEKPGQR